MREHASATRSIVATPGSANRKRIQRLMRLMGIEAIAPKPGTSAPHPEHPNYPYLLRGLTSFVERLWRSLKYEEVYLHAYNNAAEARAGIGRYLDFYNDERPHQALGYQTPTAFHAGLAKQRA